MADANRFVQRYGPWAIVAGASEGLGAAYARALARRGLGLLLAARRAEPLERLADELRRQHGVEVRILAGDLARRETIARIADDASRIEVGLLVYNAAHAPVGDFVTADPASLERVAEVNIIGPIRLARALLPGMTVRGHGGIVLMSSLAGNQGTARIAAYAASKAFNRVLAEGLWSELAPRGIDVVACCAGAVRTPGYAGASDADAPGTLEADQVAERALRALARGPIVIPGFINRIAAVLLGKLLPRRAAIRIMAATTRRLSS
jgi:short-subunit dehydrogenase